MTDKEIKDLAKEYGVLLAKDIPLSNCLKNEVINSTEDYIVEFINWLSNRYCLVEKSKIIENYQSLKRDIPKLEDDPKRHLGFLGGMTELEMLFGKELFTDTEQ